MNTTTSVYTVEACHNDTQFQKPYIDVDEWRDAPVRHRYVHGGFEDTETRFCFYFPKKEHYAGHFFQRMMPVQGDETVAQRQVDEEDMIRFAVTHGAYFIDTNMGGIVNGGGDSSLLFRCTAACAEYSRQLAEEMYDAGRPYGYVFGGSGGGFKTISCLESTEGIWDGGVPFVIGSPVAMPNVFTVRAHAMRILRNKFEEIKDAIEPGGSGDPYACLNEEEAAALKEASLMGFPMKTWCEYDSIGEGALPVLAPAIPQMDPTYFSDFWTKEGYLGANPNGSAVRDRIKLTTAIEHIRHTELGLMSLADTIDEKNAYGVDVAWKNQIAKGQVYPVFELKEFPQGDVYAKGLTLTFLDGVLEGQTISAAWLGYQLVTAESDASGRDLKEMLAQVKAGDHVLVDNSNYIATQTYHRHQVPGPEFHAWDQFRDANGQPLYPQRPFLVGPILAMNGAGSEQSGRIHGKAIVLESLMDESAFPWQADWYRSQIVRNSGRPEEENFRLYFMEHCMHTDCEEGNGGDHQHIVSYLGALYQALLDLSDWVEHKKQPRQTSGYQMNGGEVLMPATAKERRGLQPVVRLSANGSTGKVIVKAGEAVSFHVEVELPEGSGDLEEVTWSFEGSDEFVAEGAVSTTVWEEDQTATASADTVHIFEKPGTYFPVVRASSNRQFGDPFTKVRNMDRIRVIVEA